MTKLASPLPLTLGGLNVVQVSFLAMTIIALLMIMVVRFMYVYIRARYEFPGPPVKNFWTGNLDQTMADNVHEKWLQWNREYGHVFQTWNGPFSRVIYIGDPDMITTISNSNWQKASTQYDGFRPLSGDALFVQTNHDKWRIQRKRLAPAFQPNIIEGQYACFAKHLNHCVEYLDIAARDKTVVDFSSLHVLLTLDFIGDIAYGVDFHALAHGSDCRIMQLFDIVLPELMKCGLFPWRAKFPILRKTREMHRAVAELRLMAEKAVENVRHGADASQEKPSKIPKKIFEILAKQKESNGSYSFSSKELVDNYVAFLVAGADPTAHTMSFLLWEVLRNPEILARLRAEIDASIPDNDSIASIDQTKLPYLNMVVKETLRVHSTGFGSFRTCAVNTTVCGTTLPADTTLALWNPAVHRDPTLWEDADDFDPERWRSGGSGHTKIKGSYFPFSWGPRNCIGQGLAMLEMTIAIATVIRRYDLSLEPGFKMEFLPSFTLRPKNGLPIRVSRRSL